MSEQAKLEQLSEQKRRMKMLQLRRDIEQMMTERRQKHAEEMQRLMKLEEQEKEEAEQRLAFYLIKYLFNQVYCLLALYILNIFCSIRF